MSKTCRKQQKTKEKESDDTYIDAGLAMLDLKKKHNIHLK